MQPKEGGLPLVGHEYFWLDGVRCDAVGIRLQGPVSFTAPAPVLETLQLPGRSGPLQRFTGAFEGVTGTARCFVLRPGGLPQALAAVQRWVLGQPGYRRLETSEEPGFFRQAAVRCGAQTELRAGALAAFVLEFDCKPQRFYKSGELPVTLAQSGAALHNPGFAALPLVTVYGSGPGSLTVGGVTVQIKALEGSLTLDCELQDAYRGIENRNKEIYAPAFPTLPPGESTVYWTGEVQRLEITPRWWTL